MLLYIPLSTPSGHDSPAIRPHEMMAVATARLQPLIVRSFAAIIIVSTIRLLMLTHYHHDSDCGDSNVFRRQQPLSPNGFAMLYSRSICPDPAGRTCSSSSQAVGIVISFAACCPLQNKRMNRHTIHQHAII